MANYVSYLRVSTQRQGQSGLGIDAQRSAVDAYLKSVNGHLIEEFVEIESGSSKHRPILLQSIAKTKATGGMLLIAKLDRLARNVAFVSSLMEGGIEFVAADAPFANRLMLHILAAFAEHEREQISCRTKAALAAAKDRGVMLGAHGRVLAARYKADAASNAEGFRDDINAAVASGCSTLVEIAGFLNDSGRCTRQGARWSPGTVHRLLRRLSSD